MTRYLLYIPTGEIVYFVGSALTVICDLDEIIDYYKTHLCYLNVTSIQDFIDRIVEHKLTNTFYAKLKISDTDKLSRDEFEIIQLD